MKPLSFTNVWLIFCPISGGIITRLLSVAGCLSFSLLRSAIACIRGARSSLVSRRPTLKVKKKIFFKKIKQYIISGSGETVYKKFGATGMLEAPIRSLHFKLIM